MTTFSELPLSSALQRNLAASQFVTPTPIQMRALPPALDGRDVIGTAQTGTGKTLAFLIPILEMLQHESSRHTSALVLLPTRELATQVYEQYGKLRGKNIAKAALIVGGLSEQAQIHTLRAGASLVIATPGRLQDFIRRKLVDLSQVRILVLDEADRMLDIGFLPSMQHILSVLPQNRQTLCFSATMERSVATLVNDYMREPVRVVLGSVIKPGTTVKLDAYEVRPGEKLDAIRVTRDGNEVKVEVRDQGKGMPSGGNGSHKKVGVGIQGMRERIKQFGGRFEIRSDKKGTTVVASVPVPSSSAQSATRTAS